ncbi:MAG: membrane protein insertion efficiency factor YidD [Myxococcales bacterium]|nr:membrane protein insertion efficiency factor YidD [Myxococcales bacterium]
MIARLALALIGLYQRAISPLLGNHCRFHPTCSSYTATCIERFGVVHGAWLGARRIARCHPFGGSGFDPAPELPATVMPGAEAPAEGSGCHGG